MKPKLTDTIYEKGKMKQFFAFSLVLIFVITMPGWAQTDTDATVNEADILAVVNDEPITTTDVERVYRSIHMNLSVEQRENFDFRQIINKLINDKLIVQEALGMGMDQEKAVANPTDEYHLRLSISQFIDSNFITSVTIRDAEVGVRFGKNYKQAQIRSIAVDSMSKAEEILAAVRDGQPMDSLALIHSIDSQRDKGGLHKLKYWKDIPGELRRQASKLKAGQLSEPFPFQSSFMVIRLEQLLPADSAVFSHAENVIRRSLVLDKRDAAWRVFLDSLHSQFLTTIDSGLVDEIKADSLILYTGAFIKESERAIMKIGNSTVVDETKFRRELAHKAMTAGDLSFAEQVELTLKELTEEVILETAARTDGCFDNPEIISRVISMQDSLLIEVYLQDNILSQLKFNREEYSEVYNENKDAWREPGDVQVAVMLFDEEQVANQALRLLKDGADFDYVDSRLGKKNQYESKTKEWTSLASLPKGLAGELSGLPVGGTTNNSYRLIDGIGVFKLVARNEGRIKSIEEVDTPIREILFQREFETRMKEILITLKETSTIDIYEDRVSKYLEGRK